MVRLYSNDASRSARPTTLYRAWGAHSGLTDVNPRHLDANTLILPRNKRHVMRIACVISLSCTALLASCSSRQIYEGAQPMRVEDCRKLEVGGVGNDRERCLEQARMSHSEYERQAADDRLP